MVEPQYRRKRIRSGAILEVGCDENVYYIVYMGAHHFLGDAIYVCFGSGIEQVLNSEPSVFERGYIAFYPCKSAAYLGLVGVVGKLQEYPTLPKCVRRGGYAQQDGLPPLWWLDYEGKPPIAVRGLTKEQAKLPRAEIWNHESLCRHLEEGWRPDIDAGVGPQSGKA